MGEIMEAEVGSGVKFDYFRLTFADMHGIARSQLVPRRHIQSSIENGMTLFAGFLAFGPRSQINAVDEVEETHFANGVYFPMSRTLHEIPWAAHDDGKEVSGRRYKIGELFCEGFWMKSYRNGAPIEACTRYMARQQINRLSELGYQLKVGFEAEFTVYASDRKTPLFRGNDYATALRLAKHEKFLIELEENLLKSGVDLESLIVEHGSGQFELGLKPLFGIKSAEAMFLFKEGVKEMAQQRGWTATFMTIPFPDSSATATHLNHSIWASEDSPEAVNAFYDSKSPTGLSDFCRHWIAGLIKHAKAMTAICCPTVNCYRRLHKLISPVLPHKADWGMDDRMAIYRAKSYSPSGTYVENRLPSGASNPFLALACTVAAGLDGVINQLECPPPRQGGYKERLKQLEDNKSSGVVEKQSDDLPYSLEEALECLENDEVIKGALGEEFVRWFVQGKRNLEIKDWKGANSEERFQMERELYFDFL